MNMPLFIFRVIELDLPAGSGWMLVMLAGLAMFMFVKWVLDLLP